MLHGSLERPIKNEKYCRYNILYQLAVSPKRRKRELFFRWKEALHETGNLIFHALLRVVGAAFIAAIIWPVKKEKYSQIRQILTHCWLLQFWGFSSLVWNGNRVRPLYVINFFWGELFWVSVATAARDNLGHEKEMKWHPFSSPIFVKKKKEKEIGSRDDEEDPFSLFLSLSAHLSGMAFFSKFHRGQKK